VEEYRFFSTTRGRIVADLRRRRRASVYELAEGFALSTNAIRRHLSSLREEGLVDEVAVRRGRTKPTVEFALTEKAEALFPQRYDRLLNAVLREARALFGEAGVGKIFGGITARSVERYGPRLAGLTGEARIAELAKILREQGVETTMLREECGTIVLHEHNCPYAKSVAENPEICSIVHGLLGRGDGVAVRRTASIATGEESCRFEIVEERGAA
jgi:predicted ArsR family transcriptional regulator